VKILYGGKELPKEEQKPGQVPPGQVPPGQSAPEPPK
jgi:hypothetical protein